MTQNNKTANEITCEFITKTAETLGLKLTVRDISWTVFEDQRTKHRICVSKTKGDAPKVDTTVDITSLQGVQKRGADAPLNGRFVSLFSADAALIEAALMQMASADCEPLRAVKRAKAKEPVAFRLNGASEQAPAPVYQGSEDDLTAGLDS